MSTIGRLVIALGAALLAGPAAATPATECPPLMCSAIERAAVRLPFEMPDAGRFSSAATLSEALAAVLPGMPQAPVLAAPHTRAQAVRTLLRGAGLAEGARSEAVHLDAGQAARAFHLLQHPFLPGRPGEPPRPRAGVAELARSVDLDELKRAVAILLATVGAALPALDPVAGACEGEPTPPTEHANGQVAIDPAGSRTLYTKPYALTIDLGGCDVYRSLTAGADGGDGRPVSLALDLGEDSDLYEQPEKTYALGGASEGVALLLDDGGDDRYRASGYASMGAGIVGGVGILADLGGDDAYEYVGSGGGFGAHGQATIGLGALLDMGGDDLYRYEFDPGDTSFGSRLLGAQGAGTVAAIGVLADASGDDTYRAITYGNTVTMEAQGVANFLWGSTGILLDGDGSDEYTIEAHVSNEQGHASGAAEGQGVGVLDGVGLLLDAAGTDVYRIAADAHGTLSGSAGAFGQGFGTAVFQYSGLGALVDGSGDDDYSANAEAHAEDAAKTGAVTFAQGQGFLLANGALADLGGGDSYRHGVSAPGGQELSSGQGAGLGAAAGVLLDRSGADRYVAGGRSQGYGSTWHFFEDIYLPGGTGVLLDGTGRNLFTGPGREGVLWTQGVDGVGVGLDAGRAGLNGFDLVDGALLLFGLERPHAVVTSSITDPAAATTLHGDAVMSGVADGGSLPLEWVEWRADFAPWTLAERSGASWASWRTAIDVDALGDGDHTLRARAWAGGVDSAPAGLEVAVERWLATWRIERQGGDLVLGFDLATRKGDPIDSGEVTLRVLDEAGGTVATFSEGLAQGSGGYRAAWAPPAAGAYTVRAELPGQLLGQTTVQA